MERSPITEIDKIWLKENYPDLNYCMNNQIISGKLYFRMYYSTAETGYILNPSVSYESKSGLIIQDVYEIEIDLSKPEFLPAVRALGGRILASQKKWGVKNLADMHLYPDSSACLCVPPEEKSRLPNGFNLKDFFEELLIPFFYYQSFFEKYGKEPWKGYSHGGLGILESYIRQKNPTSEITRLYFSSLPENWRKWVLTNVRFKGYEPCICQSKRKFRKCHREVLHGYNKLKFDLLRQG